MLCAVRTRQKILAIRVELVVGDAEIVVYGRPFEHTLFDTSVLTYLVIVNLNDDT